MAPPENSSRPARSECGKRTYRGDAENAEKLVICLLPSLRLVLVPFAASTLALGPQPDLGAIDRYVRAEMQLNQIPGLSLSVVRGEDVLFTRAYGVASLATGAAMTPDTPVELASLSKPFTALAIAQLEKDGKLELDVPVSAYLSEFDAEHGLTVRHLVEHTSGLRRKDDFQAPCCGKPGEHDLKLAVTRLRAVDPHPPRGPGFRYANSNYVLLAAIIERVSGESFPAYMERRVFGPLGMNRTTLDRRKALAWGLAEGHERQWGRMRPSRIWTGWYGASLVKSTANDMARYMAALVGGTAGSLGLPPPEQKPYAVGWFIRRNPERPGGVFLEHTGSTWGCNTAAVIALDSRLAVVVLINAGARRAGVIARGVLARTAGLPGPKPGAEPWTGIPDFWAISFTVAAAVILVNLAVYLSRSRREFRLGERSYAGLGNPWTTARAFLLAAMGIAVPFVLLVGPQPMAAFPATVRVGLPLLAGATSALLLSSAVLGVFPKKGSA